MSRQPIQWVNTPVLIEAISRYEQNLLPRSMRLWVEQVLDISPGQNCSLRR
ncbi:MAG: hypothetical protein AB8E74_05580 [Prochlorococcus sp.]|nr:hypothetical protein [Prochlorococcaceae cyanobacterium Fu_MAG_50]